MASEADYRAIERAIAEVSGARLPTSVAPTPQRWKAQVISLDDFRHSKIRNQALARLLARKYASGGGSGDSA